MKRLQILLLLLFLAILGSCAYFSGRGSISKPNQMLKQPAVSKENQIGTYIELANNNVYFTQDIIYVNSFADNKQEFTIEKANYPKLFNTSENEAYVWTAAEIKMKMPYRLLCNDAA